MDERATKLETFGRTLKHGESVRIAVTGPCEVLITSRNNTRLYATVPADATVGMPEVLPLASRDERNLDDEEDRR